MKKKVFIKEVEKIRDCFSDLKQEAADLAAKYAKNPKVYSLFSGIAESANWKVEDLNDAIKAAKDFDKAKVDEAKAVKDLFSNIPMEVCDNRYDFDFDEDDDDNDEKEEDKD